MPKLSKSDKKFLRDVGITPEPLTPFAEERLALAKRIAKHVATTAQGNPEVARRELIRLAAEDISEAAKTDGTLRPLRWKLHLGQPRVSLRHLRSVV